MSTLWTPDGEHPVGRPPGSGGGPPRSGDSTPDEAGEAAPADRDEEALAKEMAAMRAELANSPAEAVVANHCYGLFELAAVYLSQQPALLAQASLAIDALGSLVDGLGGRLGDAEPQLRDGLSQLRLAYVQIEGAVRAGADVASGAAANGEAAGAAPAPEADTPNASATGSERDADGDG
ncbi:MAG: hypothetical protein ACRDYE_06070 [Acidimicrobiales bacterium]